MSENIFTRDLFATRTGSAIRRYVFPVFLISWGIFKIIRREAYISSFAYHGFDAACIGVGYVGAGLLCIAYYTLTPRTPREEKYRKAAVWLSVCIFTVSFSIALFRNIRF